MMNLCNNSKLLNKGVIMNKYHHLTVEERYQIYALSKAKKSQTEIAEIIKKNKSTICREMKRNSGLKGYRPKQANNLAFKRKKIIRCPIKMNFEVKEKISKKLQNKWSPEQISERFKLEKQSSVSHETIYKFIYKNKQEGGVLYKHLRRSHRKRKNRFPKENRRVGIKDALSINKQNKRIKERKEVGDWERDTMVGVNHKSACLVLVDRKSRFSKIKNLPSKKKAKKVTDATVNILKDLPKLSITNDRGLEFSDHKNLSKKLQIKVYFCNPYSSYERGTNENTIGLVRQYFPKKTDLSKISQKDIVKVEFQLNNRPRKVLDWRTPYEVMFNKKVALVT